MGYYVSVVVGTLDWEIEGWRAKTGSRHAINKIIIHNNWTRSGSFDLIALHIKDPVVFDNPNVGTICMPLVKQDFTSSVVLTGWGKSYTGSGHPSKYLVAVYLNVVKDDYCKSIYSFYDSENDLCAAEVSGKGACLVSNI